MWYAHIGDPDEITRSTVWLQFDSDLQMDEDAPFHPETLGYTVVRVLKCTPEGTCTCMIMDRVSEPSYKCNFIAAQVHVMLLCSKYTGEVTLLEPGSAGQGIIVPGATEGKLLKTFTYSICLLLTYLFIPL